MKNLLLLLLSFLTITLSCNNYKSISKSIDTINKTPKTKFVLYTSDHEDPNDQAGAINPQFESVYALSSKQYKIENRRKQGIRLSTLGHKRSPVWNKKGDAIAYISYSAFDTTVNSIKKIIVQNLNTEKKMIYENTNPCTCGLSWDESGKLLAFGESGKIISILNLETNSKNEVLTLDASPSNISISPNGKYLIFMTRDGQSTNDSDGWRPNLYNLNNKSLTKIGLLDDKFGVLGDFRWKKDSSSIIFTGFNLDENDKRLYNTWSYNLERQELKLNEESYSSFNQQKVRFWESDTLY